MFNEMEKTVKKLLTIIKKNYMQLKYPQEQLYMKIQLHHKVGCIWKEWKPNKYLYKSLGKYQELKS